MPSNYELAALKIAIENALYEVGIISLDLASVTRMVVCTWKAFGKTFQIATEYRALQLYSAGSLAQSAAEHLRARLQASLIGFPYTTQTNAELAC